MNATAIETLLSKMKEEHILQYSEFMEKILLMEKSLFKYYKKYYKRNIFFYPFKFFNYLKIKKVLKNKEYQNYLNIYLNKNMGWIKSNFIPKDKDKRVLEVITYYGKKYIVELNDYGFHDINEDETEYGWICWVKYWKFLDNKSKEIEEVKF